MNLIKNLNKDDYFSLIYERFGNIRRARGFYLYTDKKIRLLDMYLSDGRAILGHKAGRVLTTFKRELDKGIFGAYQSNSVHLLKQAVKKLFPQYESLIFATKEKAIDVMKKMLGSSKNIVIYRHFLEKDFGKCFLFLPYPSLNTSIILYKDIEMFNSLEQNFIFPKDDFILPAEACAIASFIYDVIESKKRRQNGALSHSMCSKKLFKKECKTQKEIDKLMPLLKNFFDIEGQYLFFRGDDEVYKDFFITALENKILLSPICTSPSIFPSIENYTQLIAFIKNKI